MKSLHVLRSATLFAASALFASVSFAQTSNWKIDTAHSGIEFRILHLGVSHVNGALHGITGTVHLDDKDITHSTVDATIDATTVNTDEAKRDEHLKSPEFFNVAQFPTLTFKSTSIAKGPDGKLTLKGDLTLAGVTKPITFALDGPAAPQKGMHDTIVSGFSATGTLSRKDFNFGQKYTAPVLGDDVTFTIDIEMEKQ